MRRVRAPGEPNAVKHLPWLELMAGRIQEDVTNLHSISNLKEVRRARK